MTNLEIVVNETGVPKDALRWCGKYSDDPTGERAVWFFCGPFYWNVEGDTVTRHFPNGITWS